VDTGAAQPQGGELVLTCCQAMPDCPRCSISIHAMQEAQAGCWRFWVPDLLGPAKFQHERATVEASGFLRHRADHSVLRRHGT
jgi:hypothetical protein